MTKTNLENVSRVVFVSEQVCDLVPERDKFIEDGGIFLFTSRLKCCLHDPAGIGNPAFPDYREYVRILNRFNGILNTTYEHKTFNIRIRFKKLKVMKKSMHSTYIGLLQSSIHIHKVIR